MLALVACLAIAEPSRGAMAPETTASPTPEAHVEAASAITTASAGDVHRRQYFASQIEGRPSVEIGAGDAVSAVPKRFQYAFRLNIRGVYDDNIYLRHNNRVGDVYFAIEPGITLGFGDIVGHDQNSIRIDYAPNIFLYGSNSAANAVQHLINLDGQYRLGHLSLTLTQQVQLLEGTTNPGSLNFGAVANTPTPTFNVDTGGNASVNIYTTRAGFSYDLTGKTFLTGAFNFTASDYANLISSDQIQGNAFLNYTYSPKLTFGLGGTLGYNSVDSNSPDQTFEQVNLRTTYQISGKVSLDGSVGYEFRQFEGDVRGSSYTTPVYELGATYQPFDGTTVNVRGTRRIQNSAVLAGQDYSTSNLTVSIRQRLLRRFYLGVAGGFDHSNYFNTVQFVSASRTDNYYFIQPSVDVTLTRYWTAGAYYLHRRDDSSFDAFSFYDNQVGLRTSLTF